MRQIRKTEEGKLPIRPRILQLVHVGIFLLVVLLPAALHAQVNVTAPVLTRASFAAGNDFTIALTEDGRLWAWGNNAQGQLGDGTTEARLTPVPVSIVADMIDMNQAVDAQKFTKFISVDAGPNYAMALDANGNLWGWGSNEFKQILPKSSATRFTTPVKIPIGEALRCFACGNSRSVAATHPSNALLTWGRILNTGTGTTATIDPNTLPATNLLGGLGTHNPATGFFTVTKPTTMGTITRLAAGSDATYAIANQRIWAWGDNSVGQLGIDPVPAPNTPLPPPVAPFAANPTLVTASRVPGGLPVIRSIIPQSMIGLAAGNQFALAKAANGAVYAWGENTQEGRLGTGDALNYSRPVFILRPMSQYRAPNGHISAGSDHSLAATDFGVLQVWGNNSERQLGTVSANHSNVPVRATTTTGLRPYAQCTAGDQFTITLKSDGTLSSWGRNQQGQLGLGHTNPVPLPQNITSLQLYRVDITNPTLQRLDPLEDSDNDGLPDSWEKFYYTNITAHTGATTFAVGHVTNLTAYHWGLNPTLIDNDGDGLTDLYELTPSGSTNQSLRNTSSSTSQLSPKSNPKKVDTDGDGLGDKYEDDHGFDPNNADENGNGVLDGLDDFNGDGLTNQDEYNKAIEDGIPKLKLRAITQGKLSRLIDFTTVDDIINCEVEIYTTSLLSNFATLLESRQYLSMVTPNIYTGEAFRCYAIRENFLSNMDARVLTRFDRRGQLINYTDASIANALFALFPMPPSTDNRINPDDWVDIKDILTNDFPTQKFGHLEFGGLYWGRIAHVGPSPGPDRRLRDSTRNHYQMIIEYPYPADHMRRVRKSFINLIFKTCGHETEESNEHSSGEPGVIDLDFIIPAHSRISNIHELIVPNYIHEPPWYCVDRILVPVEMVPDYNRDGRIDEADSGKITIQKPWRFWINDDDDSGDTDGSDISQGAEATETNGKNSHVDGLRDLVDFFPLKLDIQRLVISLPQADYEYRLTHSGTIADPSLRVIQCPELSPETSSAYLESMNVARSMQDKGSTALHAGGILLEDDFLNAAYDGEGLLLIECIKPTTSPIFLKIQKKSDGRTVAEIPFQIEISEIEDMFRYKFVMPGAENLGAGAVPPDPPNWPDADRNDKHFVFVHGYNVNDEQSKGWAAEFFKRLFWSGSNARFSAFAWRGYQGQTEDLPIFGHITPDYQVNLLNAFGTAKSFRQFLDLLEGEKTVAAHSMGNIVVGSAMHDWGARPKNYFMLNTAAGKECYDPAEADEPTQDEAMQNQAWRGYPKRLRASEWHRLLPSAAWPASDSRRQLTWRRRFNNVIQNGGLTEVYNFFSSGEEVLNNPTLDTPLTNDPIIEPWFKTNRVWAVQEKRKGHGITGFIHTSNHGGWRFNFSPQIGDPVIHDMSINAPLMKTPAQLPTPLTNEFLLHLASNPFFDRSRHAALYEPETGSDSTGSIYANNHRNTIISEMIPCTSFAAGRNAITVLGDQNIDMDASMKTDAANWPLSNAHDLIDDRPRPWLHSDVREKAFTHNWKVYEKFTSLGNLNNTN